LTRQLERTFFPGFVTDIKALPSLNLQRRALQIFTDLSNREFEGQPLEDHPGIGDLSDCRKVYFDSEDHRAPRYRFVYRLRPNEIEAVEVEAVAVGERKGLEVYLEVARRLGRLLDDS
jgi:mRNA interferase RelE/StbE